MLLLAQDWSLVRCLCSPGACRIAYVFRFLQLALPRAFRHGRRLAYQTDRMRRAQTGRGNVHPARVERTSGASSLFEVLDHVLDKGIVIDASAHFAVAGIELITVEARFVVAWFTGGSAGVSWCSPASHRRTRPH